MKRGVTWHDGKPFTADDVVFTAVYASDPAAAMVTLAVYGDILVETCAPPMAPGAGRRSLSGC